ncbi:MAG: NAD(P)/FAD-dependent oxidoreductase [Anaerolineae bacterium]
MTTNYDVIVIGAGSVGLPTALAMAQAGVNVLVVDRAASPGQGSHKAAIGGVRATHSEPAKIQLCLRSLEIFRTWQETYGQDIEWTEGGYVFVAYREHEAKTLKELLTIQQPYGLNIDWLDKDELLEAVPSLNPNGLLGGTLSPEDGHCSTLLAGHACYEEACRAGADFRFNEEVIGVPRQGDAVTGVITDRQTYNAPVVVNAAGAWGKQIGTLVGETHPIMPDSHEAGITEPVTHFLQPLIVDLRPGPASANCYFYQLATGQVVFCLTPDPPIPGFDRQETSTFLPLIARRLVDLVPRLTYLRVRRTWRGLYPMTPDGAPLIGWSRTVRGYLIAGGMCGQGFMLGPGVGELLARMVTQTSLSPTDQQILADLSPYRRFEGQEALT